MTSKEHHFEKQKGGLMTPRDEKLIAVWKFRTAKL
jgi:hypothetical protein